MSAHEVSVDVPVAGDARLAGNLTVPTPAKGLVLFAHGSGSSRHSPRNRAVAEALQRAGMATLLIDLLTASEEEVDDVTAELRFDVSMLASRLVAICNWLASQPATRELNIGLFGASTGAGAALITAAERPPVVAAVVSRGGRPDLAGEALPRVQVPTLLIVGGKDDPVIALNQQAMAKLHCEKQMVVVPGATHLFAEPGALEQVAALARDWFSTHLANRRKGKDSVA